MQTRALPPIQLLAAFEAAGRLGSFKDAAQELHLTPSAISQQLKQLEHALGMRLFERKPRALTLTEAGASYLEVARDTLDLFRRGTTRLHERYGRRTLRISTDAAIAYEVMIPGLTDFQRRYPEIDLRIETSSAMVDPRSGLIDAAIRFGRGPWPGLCVDQLATMIATPVAAPSLLEKQPLLHPGDLAASTLIEVAGAPDYWSVAGAQLGFRVGRRVAFDSYLATLQAASHGMGVAMGLFPLSTSWVRDGRLTTPFTLRADGMAYHLVYPPGDRARRELVQLRTWLSERLAALSPLDLVERPPDRRITA
jgi:LysR family transcriptional regulator, glycine cleavage system transcriptional activator